MEMCAPSAHDGELSPDEQREEGMLSGRAFKQTLMEIPLWPRLTHRHQFPSVWLARPRWEGPMDDQGVDELNQQDTDEHPAHSDAQGCFCT